MWNRITRRLAPSRIRPRDELIDQLRAERDRARARIAEFERDRQLGHVRAYDAASLAERRAQLRKQPA